ncbi:isochorismatase family cysteine hydrolase [Planctomicrobium piriforme]|uniref:Nicotinamidase-related amidase n=1 Tax=Planctomicrobium piriforme TaxID=1576369 RepID=A0A1I3CL59_9PLAN|nr:isochorismatase family cysteine hydrolase [Planctomicrobium piriforme]SFH75053.1 Nicotinamidase-related amidase [Planctomicrobium piriforme]
MKNAHTPNHRGAALLLIDVINDLDFPEAEALLRFARPMAEQIRKLKERAKTAGVPVIYVNDNFGQWQSDLAAQVRHCERTQSRGREIVQQLRPAGDDYFVVKPKHSGFYSTSLDVLLRHLECEEVIVTGIATNICVLFTANDAYMRDYKVSVPRDCAAANSQEDHDYAIRQMEFSLKADVRRSAEIRW